MRWWILAVLFTARTAMAAQFQSVAALSPLVQSQFGVNLADVGWLIGIYFISGVVVAYPGSALSRRFGDRNMVVFGLALMALGGLAIALSPSWGVQIVGRLVAGTGGVLLNVVMTKMVTDWFVDSHIATAMAIFIASWPGGIALALVVLPPLAAATGFSGAMLGVALFCAIGLVLMLLAYRPPATAPTGAAGAASVPKGRALGRLALASLIWGLFNASLAGVFSFGPEVLLAVDVSLQAASARTSVVMWLVAIVAPAGGYLADRTGRRDLIIAASTVLFIASLSVLIVLPQAWAMFVLIGIAAGLAAGPIMAMPAEALPPQTRAAGMGIFFTLYYALMTVGPAVMGVIADMVADARAAYGVAVVMLVVCLAALTAFRTLGRAEALRV